MTGYMIKNQSGSVIVFVVASILAIVAIVGFTIDFGRFTVAREQLKNAAESSALTTVLTLRKGCSADIAKQNARNVGHAGNMVEDTEILINPSDINVGRLSPSPNPNLMPSSAPSAAEVTARLDSTAGSGSFKANFLNKLIDLKAVARSKYIPMDIIIVQDTSGSMAGQRLRDAKRALNFMVDLLDPNPPRGCGGDNDYRVSLLEFYTNARMLVHLTPLAGSGAQTLRNKINGLNDGGGTATHKGINSALSEFSSRGRAGYPKAIFLFSDGVPNSFSKANNAANKAWNRGIKIYTVFTGDYSNNSAISKNARLSRPLSNGNSGTPSSQYAHLANNLPALQNVIEEIMMPRITSW